MNIGYRKYLLLLNGCIAKNFWMGDGCLKSAAENSFQGCLNAYPFDSSFFFDKIQN